MHTDARAIDNQSLIEGDLCIIGAGAAGISMALEFVNSSQTVILLESGGFEYEVETQSLNQGYNVGQNYFPLKASRLRFFGGTTGHWAGFCAPLDPIDFEERPWVPHSGWPFTKQDLDPFYERAQKVCELGPYNYETTYWEKLRPESAPLSFDKSKVRTKMWQKSPPTRFGTKYRDTIVGAPNINLYTYANLTNIELNESGREVIGLEIKTLSGRVHRVQAKMYVLACGAIQNVRCLLNSKAVMKNGIGNHHDLVGRFFMEHPHVDSADMILASDHNMDLYFESFLTSKEFGMLTLAEAYQRREKLLNYSAQLVPTSSGAERQHVIDLIPDDAKFTIDFMKGIDQAKKEGKQDVNPETKIYIFSTRVEQAPNPDSRVELAKTNDALGIPEVNLNWQLSDLDKRTIKEANLAIGKELGKIGLGRLRLQDWLFEENHQWPRFMAGGFHHMGITRMNKNPKKGVVDENCKIHGLPNMYIASSSVFPTSGIANPTLTIVALAIRLADHLKKMI
ncbi:MAG TPA: GMC family oxidoreductase [Anditalea sp.]|nr:GMC family oxidoreductase [Anditalea sp.]